MCPEMQRRDTWLGLCCSTANTHNDNIASGNWKKRALHERLCTSREQWLIGCIKHTHTHTHTTRRRILRFRKPCFLPVEITLWDVIQDWVACNIMNFICKKCRSPPGQGSQHVWFVLLLNQLKSTLLGFRQKNNQWTLKKSRRTYPPHLRLISMIKNDPRGLNISPQYKKKTVETGALLICVSRQKKR